MGRFAGIVKAMRAQREQGTQAAPPQEGGEEKREPVSLPAKEEGRKERTMPKIGKGGKNRRFRELLAVSMGEGMQTSAQTQGEPSRYFNASSFQDPKAPAPQQPEQGSLRARVLRSKLKMKGVRRGR